MASLFGGDRSFSTVTAGIATYSPDATDPPPPEPSRKARHCTVHTPCVPGLIIVDTRGDLLLLVGGGASSDERALVPEESATASLPPPSPDEPPGLQPPGLPEPVGIKVEDADETDGRAVLSAPAVSYRVCSRTLARAAPPFEAMLYGGFAEGRRPAHDWTVRLPEDDPGAMGQLLMILHGRFNGDDFLRLRGDGDRQSLAAVDQLHHLTVLADKYDLTHMLRPWAAAILAFIQERMGLHRTPRVRARLLSSAWELGSRHACLCIIKRMAWGVWEPGFDIELPPGFAGKKHCTSFPCPSRPILMVGELDMIWSTRMLLIKGLLRPLKATLEYLMEQRWSLLSSLDAFQCQYSSDPANQCNTAILGSLIQSLVTVGLWPLPEADNWKSTARVLYRKVCRLRIRVRPEHYAPVSGPRCRIVVIDKVSQLLAWYPRPVLNFTVEHEKHFKRTAVLTGLPPEGVGETEREGGHERRMDPPCMQVD